MYVVTKFSNEPLADDRYTISYPTFFVSSTQEVHMINNSIIQDDVTVKNGCINVSVLKNDNCIKVSPTYDNGCITIDLEELPPLENPVVVGDTSCLEGFATMMTIDNYDPNLYYYIYLFNSGQISAILPNIRWEMPLVDSTKNVHMSIRARRLRDNSYTDWVHVPMVCKKLVIDELILQPNGFLTRFRGKYHGKMYLNLAALFKTPHDLIEICIDSGNIHTSMPSGVYEKNRDFTYSFSTGHKIITNEEIPISHILDVEIMPFDSNTYNQDLDDYFAADTSSVELSGNDTEGWFEPRLISSNPDVWSTDYSVTKTISNFRGSFWNASSSSQVNQFITEGVHTLLYAEMRKVQEEYSEYFV